MVLSLSGNFIAADVEKIGQVVRRTVAKGSKSERMAVMLVTADGDFVLRRMGGNPFHDPDLEKMVGKTVRSEGEVAPGYTFLARNIVPLKPG